MLITGIRSRPIYTVLKPDFRGKFHLLIGDESAEEAFARLRGEFPPEAKVEQIKFEDLEQKLAESLMGTRLYIAGCESFLGATVRVAVKHNLNADEFQCEHTGDAERRVFCIHCKTSNEKVRMNITVCQGCQRHLLVRDHYSRRLGAYMGVMADAEAPGELPPIEERFS